MNNQPLENPVKFFRELGGLHDASIVQLSWNPAARTLGLQVDDLNSNFDGLPEYQGKVAAVLTFEEVESLMLSCDAFSRDIQRIYRIEFLDRRKQSGYQASIQIAPSGRLGFACGAVVLTLSG